MKSKFGSFTTSGITKLGTLEDRILCPTDVKPSVHPNTRVCVETTLASIEAALSRLQKNTYGICTQCGAKISVERLDDDPIQHLCDRCED